MSMKLDKVINSESLVILTVFSRVMVRVDRRTE